MKRILLFIFSIGLFSQLEAQIIMVDSNDNDITDTSFVFWQAIDTTDQNALDYTQISKFIAPRNVSTETIIIGLKREEINTVAGTGDYLCWGTQCYGVVEADSFPTWRVLSMDYVVSPSDSTIGFDFFSIYYKHRNIPGDADYKYTFFDIDNEAGTNASFNVKFSISYLSGIDEINFNKSYELFPNPASDKFVASFDASYSSQNNAIEVYNLVGKKVHQQNFQMGENALEVDVRNLDAGVYFVNILSNGKMLGSKKLVVNQ